MALEYFLYTTDYDNTLVDRSNTSFSPLPPYGEIHIDFLIPNTQPLYYYRESGGTIVLNDENTINVYLEGTAPPPEEGDSVDYGVYTGYTATTENEINYISGVTDTKHNIVDFNSFTGTTLPADYYNKIEINTYSANTLTDINTRVFRSGDTMTGSLSTSGNFTAVGAVTGSSVSASVLITTPILNASTSICAPQITGSTCIISPISCATTRLQAPVVCASTCVISPITIGSSCLCSQGTTGLQGGVTAASFLNVSGDTTLGDQLYWTQPNTGGTLNDYGVKWDPITKQIRTIPSGTGGTANVYCYSDKRTSQNNTTTTNATYLTENWSLPAGCYEYVYNALYGNTSSNRCATVCFLFDGNVVGECNLMKTNASSVITTAYVTQNNELLTDASHTISIVFRQQGGGTSFINYGVMRVQKIGEID